MQNTIILLIEQIVNALGTEFRVFLPQIVPQILRVFMHDTSKDRAVTAKVSSTLSFYFMVLPKREQLFLCSPCGLQFAHVVKCLYR